MVSVEFPAEWDDEGVLGNHGVYSEESYQEGDVDDTCEQDEQEAGDGTDVTFDMQNENENQDHDDTHEDAQDDPDEFEEVAEEIEDQDSYEAQEEDVEQAETDRDNHGWDSVNYESSRKRKRNRAGQTWGWWHQKRQRWHKDQDSYEAQEEDVEQAETDRDNHGWDSVNYESSRKRNRSGQKWGAWHQREHWSEHTKKEPTDNQEQPSQVQMFIRSKHGDYHIQMPVPTQPAESLQTAPKVQKLPARHSLAAQAAQATQAVQVVHPWHTEVTSSEPEQREQRIWPAGLASSLKKGGKGSKTKGGKGKTKDTKGSKGSKGSKGKGKTKDAAGKGKRPVLLPEPLLPDTARGLPRGLVAGPPAGPTRPKLVGPPTGPGNSAKGPQLHVPAQQTGPTRPKLVGPPTGPGNSAKGPQLHVLAQQTGPTRPKLVGPPTGPGNSDKGPQLHVPARQTGPTRPKLAGPPTGPGNSAKGPQLHVPARQTGPRAVPARPEGAKRPLGVGASHLGEGFKAEPRAPTPQLQEQQRTAQPKTVTMKVVLKPVVAEKLKQLNSRGVKLTPEALRGLAAADAKDAEVLMQALLSRGEVPNPSNFITASLANLAKRQATAPIEQSHSVQHQPAAARAAPASAGTSAAKVLPRGKGPKGPKGPKFSGTGAGPAGSGLRTAPVASPKVPGQGQPPKRRTADLPFERLAVQAKLFAVNKQGIWAKQGKALDESALSALMQIEPARGLEILDEVESRGVGLVDPSRYARDLAADEEKVYPPS